MLRNRIVIGNHYFHIGASSRLGIQQNKRHVYSSREMRYLGSADSPNNFAAAQNTGSKIYCPFSFSSMLVPASVLLRLIP
jgi:hypothetical protein